MIRTPSLFVRVCKALWGDEWRTASAECVERTRMTVWRWTERSDKFPIPAEAWEKLSQEVERRGQVLNELRALLASGGALDECDTASQL